jgi:hypothetical protein
VCCALCLFVSLLCGRERFLCRLVESRIIVRLQDMSYLSLNYDHRSIVRLQDMTYLSLNYDHRIIVRLQDMTYLSLNYDHRSIVRLQDMSYLSLNYDHRSIVRLQILSYLSLNYDRGSFDFSFFCFFLAFMLTSTLTFNVSLSKSHLRRREKSENPFQSTREQIVSKWKVSIRPQTKHHRNRPLTASPTHISYTCIKLSITNERHKSSFFHPEWFRQRHHRHVAE